MKYHPIPLRKTHPSQPRLYQPKPVPVPVPCHRGHNRPQRRGNRNNKVPRNNSPGGERVAGEEYVCMHAANSNSTYTQAGGEAAPRRISNSAISTRKRDIRDIADI
jgi:hypothetical protein